MGFSCDFLHWYNSVASGTECDGIVQAFIVATTTYVNRLYQTSSQGEHGEADVILPSTAPQVSLLTHQVIIRTAKVSSEGHTYRRTNCVVTPTQKMNETHPAQARRRGLQQREL